MTTTLAPSVVAPPDLGADVLHRVALTVNSSLDIKEVLERLARLALEAIPADRCNLFLVDGSRRFLEPALSIGRVSDAGLWQRFRAMEPIDLLVVPERREFFRSGRALPIADMADSPVVPAGVAETFRARSGLLAPLVAGDEPVGLLTLDWTTPGRTFTRDECELFEAIASYAALAVRNARLYQGLVTKNRTLERLVEVANALTSLPSLASVLGLVSGAFEELLAATHCSVNVVRDSEIGSFETIEIRGESWLGGQSIAAVAPAEVARVAKLWQRAPQPVVYPDVRRAGVVDPASIPASVRSVVVFPLVQQRKVVGAVLAGFATATPLDSDAVSTGQALADLAAAAITRARLDGSLRSRLQEVEVLYRLSDVVAGTTGLAAAVQQLNLLFESDPPVTFESVAVSSRRLRDLVEGQVPTAAEGAAIKAWRAEAAGRRVLRSRDVAGGLLVPVARRSKVLGALRVHVGDRPVLLEEEALLLAVGASCAEVIQKFDLHHQLAERERQLVVASERDRIAGDLHDSVGQTILGIGLRLSEYLHEAPDRVWRERIEGLIRLAGEGSSDLRQSIHALVFLDVRRHGLEPSLRDLTRKFASTTGIAATLRVHGTPIAMPLEREDALFRVAHEALMNVERHARAGSVCVRLEYGADGASVVVRDDGVGLGHRDPFGRQGHFGVRGMQVRVDQAGGSLRIAGAQPRGVIVEAHIPVAPFGEGEGGAPRPRRSRR